MKLLMLNYEFPPLGGGAANANWNIVKVLAKQNTIEIDLVVSSVSGFRVEQFSENIKVHYLDIGKNGNLHLQSNKDLLKYSFRAWKYIRNLRKKKEFDLVHAFFGIPCGFLGVMTGLPTIVSLRGSDVPGYNPRFKWIDALAFRFLSKWIWKKARYTIANSEGLRDLAKDTGGKTEIGLIPNGVDIALWNTRSAPPPLQENKLRIISVGRLIPRKGFNYLIKAVRDLDVNLTIVGGGPDGEYLQQLAKENNVQLELTGLLGQHEIKKHLHTADIFVLPSLNEGMSNAVLEAMACGLPIVVTNVGGAELIQANGFVVSKANVPSLKAAILHYIQNSKLMKEHSLASRQLAEKLSWERVANDYVQLYNNTQRTGG